MLKIFNSKTPLKNAIKKGVKVGYGCEFYDDIIWGSEPYLIEIGNNVRITKGVSFMTHDGGVWVIRNLQRKEKDKDIDVFGKIIVGNNVHIGWDAIIMPGVKIGNNCIIAAGTIVTKDVLDNSVVDGIPAKRIESIDEYYEKVIKKCDYTKNMSFEEKEKYIKNKYLK